MSYDPRKREMYELSAMSITELREWCVTHRGHDLVPYARRRIWKLRRERDHVAYSNEGLRKKFVKMWHTIDGLRGALKAKNRHIAALELDLRRCRQEVMDTYTAWEMP